MENYINQVKAALKGKTLHGMKSIILKIAGTLSESEQQDFLHMLANGSNASRVSRKESFDAGAVISYLQNMHDHISDYNIHAFYYDNWYDDGYEIESDDGFCEDYYKGYAQTLQLIEHDMYAEAGEAIQLLFAIAEEFDTYFNDEGLDFHMFISENKLSVDMGKLNALWGYCQLMADTGDLHKILHDVFARRHYYDGTLTFTDIIEARDDIIPHRDKTIAAWVEVLCLQPPNEASKYVREAACLCNDIKIMDNYIQTVGKNTPQAYIDYIELLTEQGNITPDITISIAKQGLENTLGGEQRRDKLAALLADAAHYTMDDEMYLYAITERFYSCMSILNFIPIYALGNGNATQAVMDKMNKMHRAHRDSHDFYVIHFMCGNYDIVFDKVKKDKKALGWSYSLKGALFPFFVGMLAHFNPRAKQLSKIINLHAGAGDSPEYDLYALLHETAFKMSATQQETWRIWCIQETGKRVDAIVSAKMSKSYYKAAELLVVLYEVGTCTNDAELKAQLQIYKQKYPRHSSFQRELRTAYGVL